MTSIRAKYVKRSISLMIAARKSMNIQYSDELGFEASERALILAQVKVYEAMLIMNCPKWAVKGDREFRKYLKKFKLKVPEYDFDWLERYVPEFWDAFRFVLLDPSNLRTFTSKVLDDLRFEFRKLFREMPSRFQYNRDAEEEVIKLMLLSLQICLAEDNQLLANPIFEIILLIWYHYLYGIGELRD